MANSVDRDGMARYELSHLDLHCLQKYTTSLTRVQSANKTKTIQYNSLHYHSRQNFLRERERERERE